MKMNDKDLQDLSRALDTCYIRLIYKGIEMSLFGLLENLKHNYGEKTMLEAYELLKNTDISSLCIDEEVEKIIS